MAIWRMCRVARSAVGFRDVTLLLLMGALLWSCAPHEAKSVKPGPPSPKLPAAQDLTIHEAVPSGAAAGKLLLDQAISEALRASPELDQIESRIGAATAQVKQAEAAFYPRLILAEEFNATDNPVYALMNVINQRRLQATVDFNHPGEQQDFASRVRGEWSLFEGGSRWFDRKAALGHRESVRAELSAARNRLVSKVTETYFQWLQAASFIQVAEKALDSAREDERMGEARLRVEMALPSEISRLKARTAEVHGNLVTARTGVRRLQAGLERLLARPIRPGEIPDPLMPPAVPSGKDLTENDDALVKQALDRRPEMAAVRALIQAANERVKSARGGLLPKLGASAQYEWDSESLDTAAESWIVGLNASWPLFEGGLTSSKIQEAQSRLKEIEARGKQVALDIALEVQQAALAVQEAAEKIQVAEERRKWAAKALEDVRHLYSTQMVNVDSLLQAEVSWNQAEVAYTAALFDGKIAQAGLRASLGDFAGSMEGQHE